MKKVGIVLIAFFLVFVSRAMAQDDPMNGPWPEPAAASARHLGSKAFSSESAFLIKFFRRNISPIDGSDCAMYPSCSTYGVEALEKHGFFMGWTMTWDRLFRCGRDELGLSPWIFVDGRQKCYDFVKSNDFWWDDGE